MRVIHINAVRMGFGGDPKKERYEVGYHRHFEGFEDRTGTMKLGRLFYATSACGWHCPVLFQPYADLGRMAFVRDLDLIVGSVVSHWRWMVVYAVRDAIDYIRR